MELGPLWHRNEIQEAFVPGHEDGIRGKDLVYLQS